MAPVGQQPTQPETDSTQDIPQRRPRERARWVYPGRGATQIGHAATVQLR